ncbi:MAG: hypothetical protein PUA69_05485 [Erysipelotrichaceae bacterium]|nr:hypothetical protein [Erysipelotrichaceae bacterium]
MANYSRTEKYKKLRESLQSDNESDNVSTRDLSRFERRLNQIDSSNFKAPEEDYSISDMHRATHARNIEKPQPQPQSQPSYRPARKPEVNTTPSYNSGFYRNENDSATFDNDFLDQYIREVKQYNIEQGNASSENTQVNILRSLNRNNQEDSIPDRPYSRKNAEDDTSNIQFEPARKQNPVSRPSYQREEDTRTAQLSSELFDDGPAKTEQISETEPAQPSQNGNSETMSREAIMQEVQNLVNGTDSSKASTSNNNASTSNTAQLNTSPFEDDDHSDHNTDSFSRHLQNERTARQQLLNETTQMRAQLDDYEDNLSEVSDKMQRTNRILNVVLIVLIIALAIILGIVIYWIVLSRG